VSLTLRPGSESDLEDVARIQAAAPGAAQWDVRGYLEYDFVVAVWDGCVAGFVVARQLAEGESELLNLAVDPTYRRRGIGRRLISHFTAKYLGTLWLEVRESNVSARKLYESLGFIEAGRRPGYYIASGEGAIVMNFHS
jgi:ribosomal-protein-alanine N-acetyltransferase